MRQDKFPARGTRDSNQEQLVRTSRVAINRSRELLRGTEHLVQPGLPIAAEPLSEEENRER